MCAECDAIVNSVPEESSLQVFVSKKASEIKWEWSEVEELEKMEEAEEEWENEEMEA